MNRMSKNSNSDNELNLVTGDSNEKDLNGKNPSKKDLKNKDLKKKNLNEKAIVHLFHDPNFLENFNKVKTQEEIIRIFDKNKIKITDENIENLHNICEKYVIKGMEIVDEEAFLENVAAGQDDSGKKDVAKKIMNIISPADKSDDFKSHFME